MKPLTNLLLFIGTLFLVEGCNTLYNAKTVQIEVFMPGKFVFPATYKNVAVRYNNSNVSYNPAFAEYFILGERRVDTTNIDSIAGKIYFDAFKYNLKEQQFFDSIIELAPGNYSGDVFIAEDLSDSADSLLQSTKNPPGNKTRVLRELHTKFPAKSSAGADTIIVNAKTGIYTEKQLKQIADSTRADLLISLDYFGTIDGMNYVQPIYRGQRYVLTQGIWDLYDLKLMNLEYSGNLVDTVSWHTEGEYEDEIEKWLPPRKDAILNASEISGANIADLFVPHWSQVERMYYSSGHVELKKADPLIQEGKWLEAAKIWKANIDNPNKSIVAKSMYNLGLACEMEGDVDAAIDWVVKSFRVFGQKNLVNAENCQNYLRILGTRKMDFKRIEYQLNPEYLINEEKD